MQDLRTREAEPAPINDERSMSTNHAAAKLRSVPKRARPGLHHPPKPAPNARGHAVTALSISRALVSKAGRVRRRNTTGLNPLAFIPAPGRLARPGAFKTYHLPQLRQLAAFARQGEAHWKASRDPGVQQRSASPVLAT